MSSNKSVFDLINAVVDAGLDIVSSETETKAARKMQIRRRVRLPRLDGDGDQMTSVLSPTGEDNVPVANVVARYAALGVELVDRDILEDRLNGLSLEQAASKYGMTRAQIRTRESRLMQAMNKLGEKIPYGKSKETLGPKIGERIGPDSRRLTIPRPAPKPKPTAREISGQREQLNRKRELNIRRLAKGGLSADEIATLMKLDRPYVDAVLSTTPTSHRATSIETRRAIIAAWDADQTLSLRELSRRFGVTGPSLTRIMGSHKPWRDSVEKNSGETRKPGRPKKTTAAPTRLSLGRTPTGRLSYRKAPKVRMSHEERRSRLQEIVKWMNDNPDQSVADVAKKFGLSESYISTLQARYLAKAGRRRNSKERIVESLIDDPNRSDADVAKSFGVSERYVYEVRRQYKDRIPKSSVPRKKRGKAPSPETRERHLQIIDRLLNTNDSESEIGQAFGISRERVRQIKARYADEFPELAKRPKQYYRTGEKARARALARRTWSDEDEQKLQDFIKENPKATIAQTRRKFPNIAMSRVQKIMRADTTRKSTVRGGGPTLRDIAKLYDELAYEGMSLADRVALAQVIADELNMPIAKTSLAISKITNARNKKSRTGKTTKALDEYRKWLAKYAGKKIPAGAKKKEIDRLAKKYDTTPGTILANFYQSSLSDAAVKAIEEYEKYMKSDDFFAIPRFSMYQQIAKSTGLSESTVALTISRWGRVQFPAEDAKKDLKRAKITPTDRQMLIDLINGKTIDEIAKEYGVSPSRASSRINLLKDLTRKHNLRIYGRTDDRKTDAKPDPKPLPPVRRRYWAEGDDLKKPKEPRKKVGKKKTDIGQPKSPVQPSVKKNNARFKDAYGTTSPDGNGDCYEAAINLSDTIADRLKLPDSSVRVVHGIPLGTGGEAEGIRYGHAWVEVARNGWDEYDSIMSTITSLTSMMGKTKDRESLAAARQKINDLMRDLIRIETEEITVYDYSNGNRHELPRMLYYAFGNIDREHARYYGKADVARQITKNQHLGPWE